MPLPRWLLPLSGTLSILLCGLAEAEPARAGQKDRTGQVGQSGFGLYVAAGDWRLAAELTTGTDASNDTVNNKDRARVEEYSQKEAQRRGETADCLLVEQVRTLRTERKAPGGPGFAVAQQVRRQLTPELLSL